MESVDILKKIPRDNKIQAFFAYLFFSLFVFVSVSLLVSKFSSTFSQLFLILSGGGRVFDVFLKLLLLLGIALCLYALIVSSWNQKEDLRSKILMMGFCLLFVFLFAFGFYGKDSIGLMDLILEIEQKRSFWEIFWEHLDEIFVFGCFYFCFVFFPLLCLVFDVFPHSKSWLGRTLLQNRPSINIVIYTLMGSALQSFFHKSYWFFYLDLLAFIVGFLLLCLVYWKYKNAFGFYEICNLSFLCFEVLIVALCSDLIEEKVFIARYVFLVFALVAWCAEWMMAFCAKDEERS